MTDDTNRRSFLAWVIFGLGAIFSTIIGVPLVCYFIDPRHRKGPKSSFKLVDGVKLDELAKNTPKQGVIRDMRDDGWNHFPNDVIGRVWGVQVSDARPDLSTLDKVKAFNAQTMADKQKYLFVFTTICPHLGCFVNLNDGGNGFACPCHSKPRMISTARGPTRTNPIQTRHGHARMGDRRRTDPDANRIQVKYEKFKTLEEAKIPLGGA